jgi:Spy/CpxP family protein refolding chaperone
MKLISALVLASLAGTATALAQNTAPPPAPPVPRGGQTVLDGADWRQRMIARGSSTVSVDQALANLTRNLSLTPDQVDRIRPILQAHHDRILAILKNGPPSMTHEQFMTQVHAISAETHHRVNALLTPTQLELVKTLGTPARI